MPVYQSDRKRVQNQIDRARSVIGSDRGAGSHRNRSGQFVGRTGEDRGTERLKIGLSGKVTIERLELLCSLNKETNRICGSPLVEGDLSPQVFCLGRSQLIGRTGLACTKECKRVIDRARSTFVPRGRKFAISPTRTIG